MAKSQLVAVVVTYNRLNKLQDTLERLCAASNDDLTNIVVFNNASTDGTEVWLAQHRDPRLVIVNNEANLGGAGGFEQAMRYTSTHLDPDWIVLMDDDARPAPHCLHAFHNADRSKYDAYAAAVYYPDGTICDMNRPWVNPFASLTGMIKTLLKRRDGFHLPAAAYDGTVRPIDGASFVGLFLSRSAIAKAGFPDGRLFIYGDDVLYTLHLTAQGGRITFDPSLRFEHDCSVVNAHDVLTPLWKVYYYHRNQIAVIRAAAGSVLFRPVLAMRQRGWRKRATDYGANADTYRALMTLGISDGLAGNLARPHTEILDLSGEK